MSKLYVFGIGGTGSRVLRALTMLLASGVECEADTIVPIIIDPDQSAADLTRTVNLMRSYQNVRKKLDFSKNVENRFFLTELLEQVNAYKLPLNSSTHNDKFKDYIRLESMSDENKALIRMLFSGKNLESNMKVGFKGNPNIGSVVLNQFQDSDEFQQFAAGFQQGDRVFIISSIFGGTGASGFPLLLKTLRTDKRMPNNGVINDAVIGAVTVLPYFSVKPSDESEIDSTTFVSKAKSALSYYERNISDTNAIDYLYYVADDVNNTYDNCEGGDKHENMAHMVELWAALAIIDFAQKHDKSNPTQHKEFGVESTNEPMSFADLCGRTKSRISAPLTQIALFAKYMNERCDVSCQTQPWAIGHGLGADFMASDFVDELKKVLNGNIAWLNEMAENKRAFAPFEWTNSDPLKRVRGVDVKYGWLDKKAYDCFENELNTKSKKMPTLYAKEQRMIEMFYCVTRQIVNNKIKL